MIKTFRVKILPETMRTISLFTRGSENMNSETKIIKQRKF